MRSRQLLFGLLSLLLVWSSTAGPIGREQAMRLAERYVQINRSSELRQAQSERTQGIEPAYYVFNDADRSGFVIISGDDATTPVLGYSDSGRINVKDLPIQLAALLQAHEQQVEALRSSNITPGVPGGNPKPNPAAVRGPLLTSLWDQDTPYNDQAPLIGSERAVTGCVATAVAQVMFYHKWPTKGKGSNTYTPRSGATGQLTADFSQSTYAWSDMIGDYKYEWKWKNGNAYKSGFWTAAQGSAVAKLMSDVGIAVNMNYNLSSRGGSGAYTGDAAKALKDNFSYHVSFLTRRSTPNATFLTAIQQELDQNNPIIMSGAKGSSGHAWVIDGYDENGYLHANWGWGGVSNGYFALSFMSPNVLGIGGGQGGYNEGQDLILARPNKAGYDDFPAPTRRFAFKEDGGWEIDSQSSNLSQNKIALRLTKLGNTTTQNYRGELSFSIRDASGQEIRLIDSHYNLSELKPGYHFISLTPSITLSPIPADGSYTIVAVCREFIPDSTDPYTNTNQGPWIEVDRCVPIPFDIRNGKIVLKTVNHDPSLRLTQAPLEINQLWQGQRGSTKLSIANSTEFATDFGYIVLSFSKSGSSKVDVRTEAYQFYDNSTFNGIVSYQPSGSTTLAEGTYDVTFSFLVPGKTLRYTDGTTKVIPDKVYPINNPFGTYRIEVRNGSGKPILTYKHNKDSNLDTPKDQTKNLEIRVGSTLFTDEQLEVDRLKTSPLSIACQLENVGNASFSGVITYKLIDPTSGEKFTLGSSNQITIARNQVTTLEATKATIPISAFDHIPADRTYHLHITANISGAEIDIWNHTAHRRRISISKPTAKTYTVTLNSGEGGSISIPSANLNAVQEGTTLNVQVQTNEGYELVSLTANNADIKATMQFVVRENTQVVARFAKKTFVVTKQVVGNGTLNISGASNLSAVPYGTELTISATPATGHELVSITANGVAVQNGAKITIKQATNLVATFRQLPPPAPKRYKVTLSYGEGGSISIPGANLNAIEEGSTLNVQVQTNEGYELVSLTANNTDIKTTKQFVVRENTQVVARFAKKTFIVTKQVVGNGTLNISGASNLSAVPYGTELTISATPATGHELVSITANGEAVQNGSKISIKQATNLVATFRQLPPPAPKRYTITLSSGEGGSISIPGADLNAVEQGTTLNVQVQTNEGYELVSLTANNADIKATKQFVVRENTQVVARFAKKTFIVTKQVVGNGTLNISGASNLSAVPYGTQLTISATPASSHELVSITANGESVQNGATITIKQATNLVATFRQLPPPAPKRYKVTLNSGEGGSISIPSANLNAVEEGTTLNVQVQTNEGYELVSLTANAANIKPTMQFVVNSDTQVVARFAKKTFVVTKQVVGNGTLNISGAQDLSAVPYGTQLTISATPASGHELASITANGEAVQNGSKISIKQATSVVATFRQLPPPAPKRYKVTLSSGEGGSISIPGADLNAVEEGTTLNVQVQTNEGYELVSLTANGADIKATKQFVVREDTQVVARFAKKTFIVTKQVVGNGTLNISGASNLSAVPYGTQLTISAIPATGYELASITANGVRLTTSKKVTITENTTIEVTFKKQTFRVILTTVEHATIRVNGKNDLSQVGYGEELTLEITPEEGYIVDEVRVNGVALTPPYKFAVMGPVIIEVKMRKTNAITRVEKESVRIYPNPASHYVSISGVEPGTPLLLMTLTGRVLREEKMTQENEMKLPLNDLEPGVYILLVGQEPHKIVVR